jgi:hypothetical protein
MYWKFEINASRNLYLGSWHPLFKYAEMVSSLTQNPVAFISGYALPFIFFSLLQVFR